MRIYRGRAWWLLCAGIGFLLLYVLLCFDVPLRIPFRPSRIMMTDPETEEESPTGRGGGEERHVWCIFTKARDSYSPIKYKLGVMLTSLLEKTTSLITLNLITDDGSKSLAQQVILDAVNTTGRDIKVIYYDIREITGKMEDIVRAMKVHFTSQPGAYYSDSLFFVSLALHRIAPPAQTRVVMLDVDTKILVDIVQLFKEFDYFSNSSLIGCGAELTPVYRHVLYSWRSRHKGTRLGSPASQGGFPGLNSGVLLLHLGRLRTSTVYRHLLSPRALRYLTDKYSFKGHLGDQDFYTVVALDHPELFHMLDCGWNRQLCTWWRDHGYRETFDAFAQCDSPVRIYHGNCNTPIPAR